MHAPRRNPVSLESILATGILVTIATGGALIGLGLRGGETSRAFRLTGRALLESFGIASASAPLTSVAVGYLHHLVVATLWGALCATVVLRASRALHALLAVTIVTIAYAALTVTPLPPALRIGYAVTSDLASVVPIMAALFVALLGGAWVHAGGHRSLDATT